MVGYNPWGGKESDMTEQFHFHFLLYLLNFFYLTSSHDLDIFLFFLTYQNVSSMRKGFLSFFFAVLRGMGDLSSPTRDQTCGPCSGSTES